MCVCVCVCWTSSCGYGLTELAFCLFFFLLVRFGEALSWAFFSWFFWRIVALHSCFDTKGA